MIPLFEALDLRDPEVVIRTLRAGSLANRLAACRRGSVDVVEAVGGPRRLVATGDLHDNPLHLARLIAAAGMAGGIAGGAEEAGSPHNPVVSELGSVVSGLGSVVSGPAHLTLQELIHSDRLLNGMDFSWRVLARVAAIKAAFPETVHVLLANHELAQVAGSGIVKDGVKVVDAFNEAVRYSFPGSAEDVDAAVVGFIRSMPLALRCRRRGSGGDVLCAHSLPPPELMGRFDDTVLDRELAEEDYAPRRGAAHLMVWGRGHTPEQLARLGERWGVGLFVLGHEKAEEGVLSIPPNAVVLNSDHERGVYLPLDLDGPVDLATVAAQVRPLGPRAFPGSQQL